MTLTRVQINILDATQQTAFQLLELQNQMQAIVAMWSTESMNTITDADLASLDGFGGVTAANLTAAKNGLDAINTAMGGYAAGTPATKLLRIVQNVPK